MRDAPGRREALVGDGSLDGREGAHEARVRPIRRKRDARLAGGGGKGERGRAGEIEIGAEREGLERRASGAQERLRAAKLHMDAVEARRGEEQARLEGQVLGAVDLERRRVLEAGDVGERQNQCRAFPVDLDRGRVGVGHVGRQEAALDRKVGGVDADIEDGSVEHLGDALAVDRQLLRHEHGVAIDDLRDGLVALLGLESHLVGDDQERTGQLLYPAPCACDLAPDLLRSRLALGDEAADDEERNEEKQDQEADEEELERRARRRAPDRLGQLRHFVPVVVYCVAINCGARRRMWGLARADGGQRAHKAARRISSFLRVLAGPAAGRNPC